MTRTGAIGFLPATNGHLFRAMTTVDVVANKEAGMTQYRSKTMPIVGLAIVLGGMVLWSVDPGITAGRAILLDPLAVLNGRSPGERAGGALLSTKPIRTAALRRPFRPPFIPRERVLTLVRNRPPGSELPTGSSGGFAPPGAPAVPSDGTSPDGPVQFGTGSSDGGGSGPSRNVESGLGNGPGAGGGGGLTSDYNTTPPLPAR